MADLVEGSEHYEEPSALEIRVLAEKAIGLSHLEVAAKLMLAERTVRSIVRKHQLPRLSPSGTMKQKALGNEPEGFRAAQSVCGESLAI